MSDSFKHILNYLWNAYEIEFIIEIGLRHWTNCRVQNTHFDHLRKISYVILFLILFSSSIIPLMINWMKISQNKNELKFNQVNQTTIELIAYFMYRTQQKKKVIENHFSQYFYMMETPALTLLITTTRKDHVFDVLKHFKMNASDKMESKPTNYQLIKGLHSFPFYRYWLNIENKNDFNKFNWKW